MLKLLHIADLHLGAKFSFLQENAEAHRKRQLQTLKTAIRGAIENKVSAILICGDTFDNPFPSKTQIAQFHEAISEALNKGIYIYILPGNHDRLEGGSVWLDYPYAQDDKVKAHLIIFNKADKDGVSNYYNEELKLLVVARPVFKQKSAQSPLAGIDSALKKAKEQYQEKTDGLRTVVLAHGSVDFSGKSSNYPIKKEEITALGADYLALGDWHGVLDVSQPEQIAYYPGALEFTQSDQERAGHALLVELLDDSKPNVKQLKVSELSLMNKEYNLEQQRLDSIIKEIASLANENLMLSLTLTGSRSDNERLVELESQFSDLNNLFYYFKLRDKTQSIIHSTKLDQYPQNSVPHEFIRLVKLKLDKKEIDQQTAEKVMRLGLGAILSDKHN